VSAKPLSISAVTGISILPVIFFSSESKLANGIFSPSLYPFTNAMDALAVAIAG
jgi:hypothetical protein